MFVDKHTCEIIVGSTLHIFLLLHIVRITIYYRRTIYIYDNTEVTHKILKIKKKGKMKLSTNYYYCCEICLVSAMHNKLHNNKNKVEHRKDRLLMQILRLLSRQALYCVLLV